MKVIGVTGNSGSGKSTVSTIIKNNTGCTVISADNMAKKLNTPGSEYYEKTVELFGEEVLDENKNIDRRILATRLFSDVEIRKQMNQLTAKYVGTEIRKLVKEEKVNNQKEFVVVDAPLLFECGIEDICDYIIAVTCDDESIKIKRICERDRLKKSQAQVRLDAQPDDEFYTSKANYVVANNKNNAYLDLIKKVLKIVHEIKGENKKK